MVSIPVWLQHLPILHYGGIDDNPLVFLGVLAVASVVVFFLGRKPKE